MTRILIGGLALCWLAVGFSAWRHRRRDGARLMPVRWHKAVGTLRGWSETRDVDPPVAATWCRPIVRPVEVHSLPLPQQRRSDRETSAV
ncbi:MAG TPA: hypothetical protein VFH66_14515 [Mycobacteriales bacterium]|nr:hypothetical protein [Mycobacteriales bacterium]